MRRERATLNLDRGLRVEDASMLFEAAAEFYSRLAGELDRWPQPFTAGERREFAAARRRLLHQFLDRALNLVELLGKVERGCWP